ncbi:hypothetical protein C8F04DRAFT_1255678 [Mycena alexandri]|uniref:Uncharacterized protein n=1 Tax=Mycena alexandri TaxID=1745969 RepID=A0AAD6T4N9_9AGAR|nr:hypothetical protein C8F04DRAFT_1255678 [Mycena alexandri]
MARWQAPQMPGPRAIKPSRQCDWCDRLGHILAIRYFMCPTTGHRNITGSISTPVNSSSPQFDAQIVAVVFAVPQELEFTLLPSPSLSIAKMLDFTLPLEHPSSNAPKPTQYFSKNAPDITDSDLLLRVRRLPIPDKKTVHKLQACSRQAWMDGAQSVMYSHLGGVESHFPPWIISYWAAVIDIKRNARLPLGRSALAQQALLMLTMVPWGCSKPAGLSDSEPFYTLWCFLGTHWLSGSQMDDMLELLRYKIDTSPTSMPNTRTWGTALIPKVLAAYRAANTGTYWTAKDLRWLRDLGDDIVQNRAALITSAHLGDITE